jgi:hypothetical protein
MGQFSVTILIVAGSVLSDIQQRSQSACSRGCLDERLETWSNVQSILRRNEPATVWIHWPMYWFDTL